MYLQNSFRQQDQKQQQQFALKHLLEDLEMKNKTVNNKPIPHVVETIRSTVQNVLSTFLRNLATNEQLMTTSQAPLAL